MFAITSAVPAILEVSEITRRFGDVPALDRVTFSVEPAEFFSLLGPSGCGKTTLLRILAGLDFPDDGTLKMKGHDALRVPAHKRPVNTVFQNYALFPHLSVWDNVAFGLRMKKVPQAELEERLAKVMELTRISELGARKPTEISGGQKQRVALARALVNEPAVLLLDEPLGALDLKLRQELQTELRALQRRTGITFIYVTHDQDEALSMSDKVAIMNHGQIIQVGSPAEVYERPRTRFVAEFLGGCNLLRATVQRRNGTEIVARTAIGDLRLAGATCADSFMLALRPERICVAGNEANQFDGVVVEATYRGAEIHSRVRVGSETLRVTCVNSTAASRIAVGDSLRLSIASSSLIALED